MSSPESSSASCQQADPGLLTLAGDRPKGPIKYDNNAVEQIRSLSKNLQLGGENSLPPYLMKNGDRELASVIDRILATGTASWYEIVRINTLLAMRGARIDVENIVRALAGDK